MEHPSCDRSNCINWKNGRCNLKNPEKEGEACLDFEDAMEFLRLRADPIRGSLGYDEFKEANKTVS